MNSLYTTRLPFPIAHPLDLALNRQNEDPVLRLEYGLFAGYQTTRLTALLLLAAYLDLDNEPAGTQSEQDALGEAIRKLRRAQWGDWRNLATKLAKFFAATPQRRRDSGLETLAKAWMVPNNVNQDQDRDTVTSPCWPKPLLGSTATKAPCASRPRKE